MKIALITGCNGGIGKSICKIFKLNDYEIIGLDINDITNEYVDIFLKTDLSSDNFDVELYNNIIKKYDHIDTIINVSAIQICKPMWEMEVSEWDKIYNCNVRSVFIITKCLLELLKKCQGNIINIGSVHSVATSDQILAYGSSKSAIVGLTRNLAIELAKFNIRVNCISPGAIDTPMLRSGLSRGHTDGFDSFCQKQLLKKVGMPEDIANFCLYLADNNKSSFITGSNLILDGGATIRLSTE
jgi:NAD(P)-dependent dehydrogenase (short-subunit alcohol dehydrogenase family)